jgi:hypothetical protein
MTFHFDREELGMASISERESREIEAANASGTHSGRLHPRPLAAAE